MNIHEHKGWSIPCKKNLTDGFCFVANEEVVPHCFRDDLVLCRRKFKESFCLPVAKEVNQLNQQKDIPYCLHDDWILCLPKFMSSIRLPAADAVGIKFRKH